MYKNLVVGSLILSLVFVTSCTSKNTENNVENKWQEHLQEQKQEWNIEHVVNNENIEEEVFSQYNYVPYSEEKIKKSTKLKVLFFNSSESSSIKLLKKNLQKSGIHDWLVMYEINFDTNMKLKNKYNVDASHTFIQVDNDLNIIRKWTNSETIEEMHTELTSPIIIKK